MSDNKIIIYEPISKETIKTQIHTIRDCQVMLDKDIAAYFDVTTGNLNRAMKRNITRFPDSFCFQLTTDEYYEILKRQSGTLELEQGKYSKYPPYVYTEQGVAMLTSVLHTHKAIEASVHIMTAFVEMSHYIQQNIQFMPYEELQTLRIQQYQLADKVRDIEIDKVSHSELSELMSLFDTSIKTEEILILDGERFKADIAYQNIYKKAKKQLIIVDDYIGLKTLRHLTHSTTNAEIIVITDNKGFSPLRLSEYEDFLSEYPGIQISFIKNMKKSHDRFIILDFGTNNMKIYLCGSSSKDSGNRITTIMEIKQTEIYREVISKMLKNPPLVLK